MRFFFQVENSEEAARTQSQEAEQVISLKEKSIKRLQIEIEQQQKTIEDLEVPYYSQLN